MERFAVIGGNSALLRALARAMLAGESNEAEMVSRCAAALGHPWVWLKPLVRRYEAAFGFGTRPRYRDVLDFLETDQGLIREAIPHRRHLLVAHWPLASQGMQPVPAARAWDVPAIETLGDLAGWLDVAPGELDWFADLKGLAQDSGSSRLSHYHYRVLRKRSGYVRLIEAPKPRLKALQGRILDGLLAGIPAHTAAHGFVRGRSIKTFAAPHVQRSVVLKMDLRDFFPSFGRSRVQAFFRTVGYPEAVANALGGLCTNATPARMWKSVAGLEPAYAEAAKRLYARPHLPQGAPSSPALANALIYRADCRLFGLAHAADAEYTRYADDLAFSGGEEFARRVERFSLHAAAVLMAEGFAVNHRKTRIMRPGVRQRLTGIVLNERLNVNRDDFDRLKAILTNCARFGPESQNREAHPAFQAHLEGRIAFVESINPQKGARLRGIFEEIRWDTGAH